MFEQTRSELVERLGNLIDRFEAIVIRANEWLERTQLADRRGLGSATFEPLLYEIAAKANEQAGLCGESITHLLRDRALPLMFKRGVRKAEDFAGQCEGVLSELDRGEQAGRQAFRERRDG